MRKRKIALKSIGITIAVLVLSLILSTYTEEFIRPWIVRLFNAVKGSKALSVEIELDERGIPITIYPELGPQRNPVNIAQYGLVYWDEGKKEQFLNIANWLVENVSYRDGFAVWEYKFPWKSYNMIPPWVSGMAQGLGVEVLGRAYHLTGKDLYLEVAKKALKALQVPIEKGGVRIDIGNGWWYEEYADLEGKNPRVLNGMIYALEGVYNFWSITGYEQAKMIFDKGVIALKASLPSYDALGWTYYDALGNIASKNYHHIHIRQMKWLYKVTGDPVYAHYAADWENDLVSPFRFVSLLLLRGPQESDFVILLINMMAIIFLTRLTLMVLKRTTRNKN